MEALIRSYAGSIDDVSMADRTIVATVNTGDLDRYATVIDPRGIDLKAYRANPVVLWEHSRDPNRGSLPIGRNVWIKEIRSGNGSLRAMTKFAKDDYSQALLEMYRDETLRGWSINVLPHEDKTSPPTREERRARPELERCKMMYRGGELAEYSGVSIPGNSGCLTILEARGIWVPDEARELLRAENPRPMPGTVCSAGDDEEPDADDAGGPPDGDEDDETRKAKAKKKAEAEKPERTLPRMEGTIVDPAALLRQMRAEVERNYAAQRDYLRAYAGLMLRGRV